MRCKNCKKEITGIGKPALPPAIPALVAWAGAIWAMWFLTLGDNPLPSWTPTPGWAVGLGSLAVATVMGWIALTRRKCPDCRSRQMFEAMEEESLLASERQAAVEQARSGGHSELYPDPQSLRAEIEAEVRVGLAKETAELRGRLEKELRDEISKQMQAGQVESERGLRHKLSSELRPEIEKELRPQVEHRLRSEIEKELRPQVEHKLRPEIEKGLRPQIEQKLRPEIERELRPQIEQKLRPEIERELRPEIEKELRANLPKPSQGVAPQAASAGETLTSAKATSKPAGKDMSSAPAKTPTPVSALPGLGRVPAMRPTPPPATDASSVDAPKSATTAEPAAAAARKGQGTIPRFPVPAMPRPSATRPAACAEASATPTPVSMKPPMPEASKTPTPVLVKPSVPEASKTPTPVSVKPSVPEASKTPKAGAVDPPVSEFSDVPTLGSAAAPHPEEEPAESFAFAPEKPAEPAPVLTKVASTEPDAAQPSSSQPAPEPTPVSAKPAEPTEASLSLSTKPRASVAEASKAPERASARSPESAAAAPTPAKPGTPGLTPSPVAGKRVGTPVPGTTTDLRERAERRARVIVSDLSLYHKDLLTKAAQATDAKKELGTLWRDAVLAYDRTVSLEVRSNTHYLEDELDKCLAQLRQVKAPPAGQPHG